MKFHMDDLKYQALTLPEEVRMYHYAGDFSGELDCIGRWLKRDLPFALRKRLEHTFFLVPGYGAQGGTADDVRFAFDKYGRGAIVNASRSIMCAWQKTGNDGKDFGDAARNAAIAMRDDLKQFITVV